MRPLTAVAGGLLAVGVLGAGVLHARGRYPEATPAGVAGRTWVEVNPATPARFPATGDALLRPVEVREGPGGSVFVLDFGDFSIKKFAPTGALLHTYGGRRGHGPGELWNPTDFHVDAAGRVWVLDPGQGRIQPYDADGKALTVVPLRVPATRFSARPDGKFVALGYKDDLLQVLSPNGDVVASYGRLVRDQLRRAVALQGEVAAIDDGGVIYAPLRAGYLARFGPGGELRYYRETVDPKPYPDIRVRANGGRSVSREFRERLSAVSMSVSRDSLYVLTGAMRGRRRIGTIDVYDLRTGTYHYSFVSPARGPRAIHVTPTSLYVVGETTVTRWPRAGLLRAR